MRLLEVGRRLDLAAEAIGSHDRGELGPEHLHRDPALVAEILGYVHGRHATRAELTLDVVAPLEGGVQADDGVAHGWS